MKHFFVFCRRNRLFAALLAAELAVVCALAAGCSARRISWR